MKATLALDPRYLWGSVPRERKRERDREQAKVSVREKVRKSKT